MSEDGVEEEAGGKRLWADKFVIIDLRSAEEVMMSGGGSIPNAIHISPETLLHPDALEKCINDLESIRGLSICIIDMSGSQAWKKLLLGQGDEAAIPKPDTNSSPKSTASIWNKLRSTQRSSISDMQSPFESTEIAAINDDNTRPASRLASILQSHNFPLVMCLDGGFAAIVSQLHQSAVSTQPIIIDHDHAKWSNYFGRSGSEQMGVSDIQAAREEVRARLCTSTSTGFNWGDYYSPGEGTGRIPLLLEAAKTSLMVSPKRFKGLGRSQSSG